MSADPAIIKLTNVRLSFPHLFEPHAMVEDQEKKYSAVFILDNNKHAELLDQIEATAERLALDEFKKKIRLTGDLIRDGNEKPDVDGYGDGVSFISASRKTRPAVVNRDPSIPITEADGIIYAGCYVNATVRLWVQNNKWGKRVNAELRAVQFVRDGESFGAGTVNAEDEFDAVEDNDKPASPGRRSSRSGSKPAESVDDF